MADPFQSMLAGLSSTGMSTTEIARQSGLSRQTLYRIKNGEAREPTYDTYQKIDRVYRNSVPAQNRAVNKSRL